MKRIMSLVPMASFLSSCRGELPNQDGFPLLSVLVGLMGLLFVSFQKKLGPSFKKNRLHVLIAIILLVIVCWDYKY